MIIVAAMMESIGNGKLIGRLEGGEGAMNMSGMLSSVRRSRSDSLAEPEIASESASSCMDILHRRNEMAFIRETVSRIN